MTLDDLCSRLLPPDDHMHFETLILEDHHLTLVAAMTAPKAVCPDCHQPSQRRHSGYPRTLADLPWALMPVVGIDDWAWRKGHRYGTIVVDLERGCPIDVLEDRLADTVADWFKAHPEVNVVARDRSESYASGIRQGAPEAVQVADRFHLIQNVAAALEQVFSAHHQDLDALNEAQRQALVTRDDGSVA